MQKMRVWCLRDDSLEKEMATQFSILVWRIPWTEEPGGLQSIESQRVWHGQATEYTIWKGFYADLWDSLYSAFSSRNLSWESNCLVLSVPSHRYKRYILNKTAKSTFCYFQPSLILFILTCCILYIKFLDSYRFSVFKDSIWFNYF